MTYENDTFNKITVVKKDGRVGVLSEKELLVFSVKKNETPVFLGKRVLFTLSKGEMNKIRKDYLMEVGA